MEIEDVDDKIDFVSARIKALNEELFDSESLSEQNKKIRNLQEFYSELIDYKWILVLKELM